MPGRRHDVREPGLPPRVRRVPRRGRARRGRRRSSSRTCRSTSRASWTARRAAHDVDVGAAGGARHLATIGSRRSRGASTRVRLLRGHVRGHRRPGRSGRDGPASCRRRPPPPHGPPAAASGVGIGTPEQAAEVGAFADGAVVGTALMAQAGGGRSRRGDQAGRGVPDGHPAAWQALLRTSREAVMTYRRDRRCARAMAEIGLGRCCGTNHRSTSSGDRGRKGAP